MNMPYATAETIPVAPDLGAIKARQQGAWSAGDYAVVGTTLQIVGEQLCETLDIRAGQKVLDVAAGNGNAALAAARRGCEVIASDYVQSLLEREPELRRYYEEHVALEGQLTAYQEKHYLTPDEEVEKKRLQKLKLAGKDRIMEILARHRGPEL